MSLKHVSSRNGWHLAIVCIINEARINFQAMISQNATSASRVSVVLFLKKEHVKLFSGKFLASFFNHEKLQRWFTGDEIVRSQISPSERDVNYLACRISLRYLNYCFSKIHIL